MTKGFPRRLAMFGLGAVILAAFGAASIASGGVTVPQVALAVAGFAFGYVVIRLSESMVASSVERRRHAQRRLILAAAIPALVLTAVAVERGSGG